MEPKISADTQRDGLVSANPRKLTECSWKLINVKRMGHKGQRMKSRGEGKQRGRKIMSTLPQDCSSYVCVCVFEEQKWERKNLQINNPW